MRKSYSGNAVPTTLSSGISPTDMTFSVGSTTNWPDTAVGPFVITVDRGQGTLEEKMLISSFSGVNLTVEERGWDGTTAQSHSSGATAVHTLDADSINTHDEVVNGVGTVTPSTSAVGDAASEGTQVTAPAAGDHKHARESFATGVTSASAPGDSAVDGASVSPARADHKHSRESVATLVTDLSPSLLGLPMALTGAVAATRFVGGTTSGPPTAGTFDVGDFSIDQTGGMWICTTGGTPGIWVTPATFNKDVGRCYASTGSALTGTNLLTLDTQDYVKGNVTYQSTAGNSGLVVVTPGVYRMTAQVKVTNANSGLLTAYIAKNSGATMLGFGSTATLADPAFQASVVTCQRPLVANDVVNVGYSGMSAIAPLQIDANNSSCYLEIELVTQ